MRLKYILPLALLLAIFSGCNQTDDVIEIFTGKQWKLTGIYYDKGGKNPTECQDYWSNEDTYNASKELLRKAENFIITFTGIEDGDMGIGEYNGRAANNGIKGSWQANGKNNAFSVSGQANPSGGEDILGQAFINGLIAADKYEGDVNNLRIYFQDKNKKDRRYLMFHVANN